eukprot:TRINITY_DN7448_c0_g2_i2.p1 TRINITY_DN7448_c0_g2~~TRINITY_DN7448_c0_g2_i2.p1  ORF type:complete len:3068 (+),score=1338.64 TRINITY_DN7448_c0_g2_i2:167-9370(+)
MADQPPSFRSETSLPPLTASTPRSHQQHATDLPPAFTSPRGSQLAESLPPLVASSPKVARNGDAPVFGSPRRSTSDLTSPRKPLFDVPGLPPAVPGLPLEKAVMSPRGFSLNLKLSPKTSSPRRSPRLPPTVAPPEEAQPAAPEATASPEAAVDPAPPPAEETLDAAASSDDVSAAAPPESVTSAADDGPEEENLECPSDVADYLKSIDEEDILKFNFIGRHIDPRPLSGAEGEVAKPSAALLVFSKYNPETHDRQEIARTEPVSRRDPQWGTIAIPVSAAIEGNIFNAPLLIEAFDSDPTIDPEHPIERLIGSCVTSLSLLFYKKDFRLIDEQKKKADETYKNSGLLEVDNVEVSTVRPAAPADVQPILKDLKREDRLRIQLRARDLENETEVMEPFLVCSMLDANGETVGDPIITEVVPDSHNPEWKTLFVPVSSLCTDNYQTSYFVAECFNNNKGSDLVLIGSVRIRFSRLFFTKEFKLVNDQRVAVVPGYSHSGMLQFASCAVVREPACPPEVTTLLKSLLPTDRVRFQFRAHFLDQVDPVSKPTAYMEILRAVPNAKDPSYVYTTEADREKASPNWDSFTISVEDLCGSNFTTILTATVFDSSSKENPDVIGQMKTAAGRLFYVKEFELTNLSKKAELRSAYQNSGYIELASYEVLREPKVPEDLPALLKSIQAKDRIKVTCRLRNLPIMDPQRNTTDAYIEFARVTPKGMTEIYSTEVVDGSQAPSFKAFSPTARLFCAGDPNAQVLGQVFQAGRGGGGIFIGKFLTTFSRLFYVTEYELANEERKRKSKGRELNAGFIDINSMEIVKEKQMPPEIPGILKGLTPNDRIKITMGAVDLDPLVPLDIVDSFVVIARIDPGKEDPNDVYTSEIVKNSKSPRWRTFSVLPEDLTGPQPMKAEVLFEVYVRDAMGAVEIVGFVQVPLTKLFYINEFELFNEETQQKRKRGYQNSGVINLFNFEVVKEPVCPDSLPEMLKGLKPDDTVNLTLRGYDLEIINAAGSQLIFVEIFRVTPNQPNVRIASTEELPIATEASWSVIPIPVRDLLVGPDPMKCEVLIEVAGEVSAVGRVKIPVSKLFYFNILELENQERRKPAIKFQVFGILEIMSCTVDVKDNSIPSHVSSLLAGLNRDDKYKLQLRGRNLALPVLPDSTSISSMYAVLYRLGEDGYPFQIHRTETVEARPDPDFSQFTVSVFSLSNFNKELTNLHMEVFARSSDNIDYLVGKNQIPLPKLFQTRDFELYNEKTRAKKRGYRNSGTMEFSTMELVSVPPPPGELVASVRRLWHNEKVQLQFKSRDLDINVPEEAPDAAAPFFTLSRIDGDGTTTEIYTSEVGSAVSHLWKPFELTVGDYFGVNAHSARVALRVFNKLPVGNKLVGVVQVLSLAPLYLKEFEVFSEEAKRNKKRLGLYKNSGYIEVISATADNEPVPPEMVEASSSLRIDDTLRIWAKARDLYRVDGRPSLGSQLVIAKVIDGERHTAYSSEIVKTKDFAPTWKQFRVPARELCESADFVKSRVSITVLDYYKPDAPEVVGSAEVSVARLFSPKDIPIISLDRKKRCRKSGERYMNSGAVSFTRIEVVAEPAIPPKVKEMLDAASPDDHVRLLFSASKLDANDGKPADVSLLITRASGGKAVHVYNSEVVPATLDPTFRSFNLPLRDFCDDPKRGEVVIELFHNPPDNAPAVLIGALKTQVAKLFYHKELDLINDEAKRTTPGYQNSGFLQVQSADILKVQPPPATTLQLLRKITPYDKIRFSVSAKGLEPLASTGTANPFLLLSRAYANGTPSTAVYRTEVVSDNLNPSWKAFYLPVPDILGPDATKTSLIMQVFDSAGELIGESLLTAAHLLYKSEYMLIHEPKRVAAKGAYKHSGIVYLKYELVADPPVPDEIASMFGKLRPDDHLRFVARARSLDHKVLTGACDPVLSVSKFDPDFGSEEEILRTEAVRDTTEPQWKQFRINFRDLCDANIKSGVVTFSVMHDDEMGEGELIGRVKIPVAKLFYVKEFELFNDDKRTKAKHHYQSSGWLEFAEVELIREPICLPPTQKLLDNLKFTDYIRLQCKARNLDAMDEWGSSDPFVTFTKITGGVMDSEPAFESEVVTNSLNPEWRPWAIRASSLMSSKPADDWIEVSVYDRDPDNRRQLIGSFKTTVSRLFYVKEFDLVSFEKKAKDPDTYQNSGVFVITSSTVSLEPEPPESLPNTLERLRPTHSIKFFARARNLRDPEAVPCDAMLQVSYLKEEGAEPVLVYKSEVRKADNNAEWKPFAITVRNLVGEDQTGTIFVDVLDATPGESVGVAKIPLSKLLYIREFPLINERRPKPVDYATSPFLVLDDVQILRESMCPADVADMLKMFDPNDRIKMKIRGIELDKVDLYGKSDPYLVISRIDGGSVVPVHTTEHIDNNCNPDWAHFTIAYKDLVPPNVDPFKVQLRFECFDWDVSAPPELIGSFSATAAQVFYQRQYELICPPKAERLGDKYKHSGIVEITSIESEKDRPIPRKVAERVSRYRYTDRISIRAVARNLDQVDALKPAPFLVLSRLPTPLSARSDAIRVVETEPEESTVNPDWKPVVVDIKSLCDPSQPFDHGAVLIEVWNSSRRGNTLIGSCETTLQKMFHVKEFTLTNRNHKKDPGCMRARGTVSFTVELQQRYTLFDNGSVFFEFSATNLRGRDPSKPPEPYLVLWNAKTSAKLNETEVAKIDLDEPTWKPLQISSNLIRNDLTDALNEPPIEIEVWQYDKVNTNQLIASTTTTLSEMLTLPELPLYHIMSHDSDDDEDEEPHIGTLKLLSCTISRSPAPPLAERVDNTTKINVTVSALKLKPLDQRDEMMPMLVITCVSGMAAQLIRPESLNSVDEIRTSHANFNSDDYREVHRTVIKTGTDPIYKSFQCTVSDMVGSQMRNFIVVECIDTNSIQTDKHIGIATLNGVQLFVDKQEHFLFKKDDENAGILPVNIETINIHGAPSKKKPRRPVMAPLSHHGIMMDIMAGKLPESPYGTWDASRTGMLTSRSTIQTPRRLDRSMTMTTTLSSTTPRLSSTTPRTISSPTPRPLSARPPSPRKSGGVTQRANK